MTGTASSTMPCGLLPVLRKASTTLRRFSARTFFWPLPVAMVSRRFSTSAAMSKLSRRFWIAVAPMWPSKYLPNQFFISVGNLLYLPI